MSAMELANAITAAAQDKGATKIVALNVSASNPYTDMQIIMSGSSERNVAAIAEGIVDDLLEIGVHQERREGFGSGRWILIDYGNIVVHIFHEEEREFYALERLWRDAEPVELDVRPVQEVTQD